MAKKDHAGLIAGKLRSQKGETLIESLTALLIISFSVIGLVACILTAANINKRTAGTDYSFTPAMEADGTQDIRISGNGVHEITIEADRYSTRNGYLYYGEPSSDGEVGGGL